MTYYCDNCKVHTRPHLHNCPLCGKHIDGEHDPAQNPAYPKPDLKYYHNIKIIQIINVLLLFGIIICLIIDLFFTRTWWSAYVISSGILFYLVVVYPVNRKIFYWKEIFIDITVIFLYVLFIDIMNDRLTWSVTYIIPIVCAVFAIAVSIIIALSRNKTPAESLLALLIVLLFSFIFFMVSLFVFGRIIKDFTIIPSFVALLVSAVCLLGFAMFRFRDFVKELFKKFRF